MRFLSTRKFWISVCGFLMTVVLWYLQLFTETPIWPFDIQNSGILQDIYCNQLYPRRIAIGFIFAVIINVIIFFLIYIPPKNKKKLLLERIFKIITLEEFSKEESVVRITYFEPKSRITAIYKLIFVCIMKYFALHNKKGLITHYIKQIPDAIFHKHLHIVARGGNRNETCSSTIFKIVPNCSDANGIVPYVWADGRMMFVNLPSISKIDFSTIREPDITKAKLSRREKDLVVEYMKKSYIKSVLQLKTLHLRPEYIWATPIIGTDEKIAGILILEIEKKEPTVSQNSMAIYSKIIERISSIDF